MWQQIKAQPIRFFALLCVMATAALLAWFGHRLISVLESTKWCSSSIQAERITPGNSFQGLTGCLDILKIQVPILGTALHIVLASFALSLLTLVVIVIARAKGNATLPGGISASIESDVNAAAEHVVQGAEIAAAEVKAP